MCRDFVFVRFHLLAFRFTEFRTCRTQPSSIFRQTVEGSLGFAQTIKTSKVDRWFGLIGNQDCNRTKGTSFIAIKPHFGCNPDCFDYERNARIMSFTAALTSPSDNISYITFLFSEWPITSFNISSYTCWAISI